MNRDIETTLRFEERNNQTVLIVVSGETEAIAENGERLPIIRRERNCAGTSHKLGKVEQE